MFKPSSFYRIFVLLCSLCLFIPVEAANLDSENTPHSNSQTLSDLSTKKVWLDLLHYHAIGLTSRFESQADDPSFFFAPEGKYDAEAELIATVRAFENSDYSENSAICRFPARLHWLQQHGLLITKDSSQCSAFTDWFNKIDAKSLTLAFPAAYLNSPSSMYGHTFIRINRKKGSNPLLDYSINYAANADPDDNELVFSYKGLSGGYPGVFSVLPYYQKVNEYSFLESRDVWEYELNLNQEEVEQFIRHTWEIQNTYFEYYFFNENCSYHLLTLIDAASPRFNLSDEFTVSAIPADTVRAISDAGMVNATHFRPSTMSQMTHMLKETDQSLQEKAKLLVESDIDIETLTAELNSTEQAKMLDLAYQYSRYISVRKKQDQKKQSKRAIAILSSRSKVNESKVFSDHPLPKYRDDQGHNSKRLEASFGQLNEQNFTQFGLRMAYHDRLDNLPGYLKGAKLEMFHFKVRHTELENKKDTTTIEEIRLIDIASYSPRNEFLTPISWEVSTGFKRPEAQHDQLVAYLNAGWGASYLFSDQQFYALGFFDLNADKDIHKGYHFSAGPKLGWLSQHETWSVNLEFQQRFDISGAEFRTRSIEIGLSKSLAKDWQIRLNGQYSSYNTKLETDYSKDFSLSLMHYF